MVLKRSKGEARYGLPAEAMPPAQNGAAATGASAEPTLPGVTEQLLHAVEDMVRIASSQREKRRLQKIWIDKRNEALAARRRYEVASEELSRLIESTSRPSPLFDGVPDTGLPEKVECIELSELGIPQAILLSLGRAGVNTIGDYYACSHYGVLGRLSGMNDEKATLVAQAVASYQVATVGAGECRGAGSN